MNNQSCPVCLSVNVTGDYIETDGDSVWQKVQCCSCLSEWDEVYTFSYIDEVKDRSDQ